MSRIYVDNERKQIVFEDTNENIEEDVISLSYIKQGIQGANAKKGVMRNVGEGIGQFLSYYLFNRTSTYDECLYIVHESTNYLFWFGQLIYKALDYFSRAELNVYRMYKGLIYFRRYSYDNHNQNNNNITRVASSESRERRDDKYEICGWSPRCLNDDNWAGNVQGRHYFTDKIGHTCIFCIKKDPEIEGGNIVFYPRYKEDSSLSSYMGCGMPQGITIPLRTGSVVVLSGDVYHTLENMKMKPGQEMYLVVCEFFHGLHAPSPLF